MNSFMCVTTDCPTHSLLSFFIHSFIHYVHIHSLVHTQARPDIFDLTCQKPALLYERVVPVDERVILRQFTPPSFHSDGQYESHVGVTGESVLVVQEPDLDRVRQQLEELRDAGVTALAVCLMHAYVYPEHEKQIGALAATMGCFDQISLSHATTPMVKLVSRGHTTAAAAYLTPKITAYLAGFVRGFDESLLSHVPLTFMKSDGGLAPVNDFGGHQAILSGPAGGVVGYAKTAYHYASSSDGGAVTSAPVIGFDMGQYSTARFDRRGGCPFVICWPISHASECCFFTSFASFLLVLLEKAAPRPTSRATMAAGSTSLKPSAPALPSRRRSSTFTRSPPAADRASF